MAKTRICLFIAVLCALAPTAFADTQSAILAEAEQAALQTLDRFMTTFNQRDPQAWAAD